MLVAKDLQKKGHKLHLILGTMTAQLGDPSGKDSTRPILNSEDVISNAKNILDICNNIFEKGLEVHFNHNFFENVSLPIFLTNIASKFTISQLMARDGFRKRESSGNPIGLHELILPILQGWDSVQVDADIEIGGTDQLFNFQISRQLQEGFGQEPEVCIMTPVINGTDGRKMSKSFANCIWVDEEPNDIFGKVMSLSDETSEEWIKIFFDLEIKENHPMARKKILANKIVKLIHNDKAAEVAELYFLNIIQKKEIPDKIDFIDSENLLDAVMKIRGCSKSESRRLAKGGAIKVNDKMEINLDRKLSSGDLIKVGKRNFARIK